MPAHNTITTDDLADRLARSKLAKPGVGEVASGRMTIEEWLEARGATPIKDAKELAAPAGTFEDAEDAAAFHRAVTCRTSR